MLDPVKRTHLKELMEKAGKKKENINLNVSVNEPELAMNPIETVQKNTTPTPLKPEKKNQRFPKQNAG